MTASTLASLALYAAVLGALVKPLGGYIARVYRGDARLAARLLGPLERLVYRALRIDPHEEMTWKTYALAAVTFNVAGLLTVYLLQRVQSALPLNPAGLAAVSPHVAFNTAVSFASNTNWQSYSGETTLAHATQVLGLTVQNFASAATGMAVLAAFVRGFTRTCSATLGSFWVDLTRGVVFVLLPLALVSALFLVSQGVVQSFEPRATGALVDAVTTPGGETVTEQHFALGPAASQVAIKQLGTNGGGFFSELRTPFGPTPLSGFVESLAHDDPGRAHYTFGALVGDTRQGWAVLRHGRRLPPLVWLCVSRSKPEAPRWRASRSTTGGAMQPAATWRQELRFGVAGSALWAAATTATSNGSVNAMLDSFTPLGGLAPMWLMQLGEVVFGGVGSGLYGMLIFALVAVFVAGLMVGRTPEYLGKKIEAYEMKMAAIVVLVPPALVLVSTAIACVTDAGRRGVTVASAHGFSEILYAFSSQGNNNGSSFAGLAADTPFYTALGAVCMFGARYWLIVPVLAIAGALAAKRAVPGRAGRSRPTIPSSS